MDGKRIRNVDKEKLRKKFKDMKKQNLKGKKMDKRQGNRSKLKLEHDSINKEGLKKYCVLEKYCFQKSLRYLLKSGFTNQMVQCCLRCMEDLLIRQRSDNREKKL
jgi:hypothetical protein